MRCVPGDWAGDMKCHNNTRQRGRETFEWYYLYMQRGKKFKKKILTFCFGRDGETKLGIEILG